jgi:hypothetical protein
MHTPIVAVDPYKDRVACTCGWICPDDVPGAEWMERWKQHLYELGYA